jgi:hypothetical protein
VKLVSFGGAFFILPGERGVVAKEGWVVDGIILSPRRPFEKRYTLNIDETPIPYTNDSQSTWEVLGSKTLQSYSRVPQGTKQGYLKMRDISTLQGS